MRTIYAGAIFALLSTSIMAESPIYKGSSTSNQLTGDVSPSVITGVSKDQVENRIELVERLVRTSSAARRVKISEQPEIQAGYANVMARLDQAVETFEAGDYGTAYVLLTEVTTNMFETARRIDASDLLERKRSRDFDSRRSSVEALLVAHGRISKEKGHAMAHDGLMKITGGHVEVADALAENGKYIAGRQQLDAAYTMIKVSIKNLRGGDTLVRSLEFATPEDEYHYELDRNDTHRMLVTVLAKEKLDTNPAMSKKVAGFLQKADTMRGEAEQEAAKGDYTEAIAHLEASTSQVVRAIHGAGIYIPGG